MERFHGHSDEPQKDLNSSKDFLQDPSIDVQFVDKENVYNLNESFFRMMCVFISFVFVFVLLVNQ